MEEKVILYVEDRESECSFKQTCLFYRIFLSVFFILLNISVSLLFYPYFQNPRERYLFACRRYTKYKYICTLFIYIFYTIFLNQLFNL
jgi:hypothetical protein